MRWLPPPVHNHEPSRQSSLSSSRAMAARRKVPGRAARPVVAAVMVSRAAATCKTDTDPDRTRRVQVLEPLAQRPGWCFTNHRTVPVPGALGAQFIDRK